MKNSLKTGMFILGIAICAIACDPPHTSSTTPAVIDTPLKKIDTTTKASIDTVKKDTVRK